MVVIISTSGVMSPGPLFTANIYYGLKEGVRSGIKMSAGHATVELPLMILLGVGALSLESFPQFKSAVGIFGAAGLFAFAALQLRQVFSNRVINGFHGKHGAFFAGILMSAANPFFIIWWLSIGFKLISDSIVIWSIWGIGILFALHIWMDFAWLGSTAYLSSKVSALLSNKGFKILIIGLSAALVYFGITFLIDVLNYPQS